MAETDNIQEVISPSAAESLEQEEISFNRVESEHLETVGLPDSPPMKHDEIVAGGAAVNLTPKAEGKYKFERTVGLGGMKAVLQVKDKDTMRSVAMAVIPGFEERSESDVLRFIQEARINAGLEHPNIVPIHEIGVDNAGAPYFTMKLLRGVTLAFILKKIREGEAEYLEKYDLQRLLRIFMRICNAIAYAHSQKIIHLDLKPENVHVADFGEVYVLDWGLAKFIGDSEKTVFDKNATVVMKPENLAQHKKNGEITLLTLDGVAKGTPGYMAPEQAAGQNRVKDERTDIYALGAILYAMLTFNNPLSNKNYKEAIRDTIEGNIGMPRDNKPAVREIPPAVEAIVLKAMHRSPSRRYQSVAELRQDIIAYTSGYATQAEAAGSLKKTVMFFNRNLLATLLFITLALLFAGIFILLYGYWTGMLVILL